MNRMYLLRIVRTVFFLDRGTTYNVVAREPPRVIQFSEGSML